MKPMCKCDETLVGGVRVPPPIWHDCGYIRRRNALIPTAMLQATIEAGQDNGNKWTRVFAGTMEHMYQKLPKS